MGANPPDAACRVATRYRDVQPRSLRARLRAKARMLALRVLSLRAKIPADGEWIRFTYYHHVLDDERKGMAEHLKLMRRHGDFITLDDAVAALQDPAGIGGRYFCVTFDDGFRNCLTHAMPILVDHDCPAAFFLPTDYIGATLDEHWNMVRRFFDVASPNHPLVLEFLNWDDCRAMARAGMTFGSHTSSHVQPITLTAPEFQKELAESKASIERELGRCDHFCCPWGTPGLHFDPKVHPDMVRQAGFKSFLTTCRGPNYAGADPFAIRREHAVAADDTFVIRYFFSRR